MSDAAAGLKQKEQLAYRPPTEQISRNAFEMGRIEGLRAPLRKFERVVKTGSGRTPIFGSEVSHPDFSIFIPTKKHR